MAGYGGFQGRPYPTRSGFGAPASGVVQSDPEFNTDWTSKLQSMNDALGKIPTTISNGDGTQLVAGGSGYDSAAAKPYLDEMFGNTGNGYRDNLMADARNYFNTNSNIIDPYTNPIAGAQGGSHIVGETFSANPAYAQAVADIGKAQTDWNSALAQRSEAQTRNQQAYDTSLMGNGAVGGVMPSEYSSPTYGQITGRPGGLGGLGGADLSGVDNAQQSGAYMGGSGAYNPNPFAPGSFQNKSPWGGF